MDVSSSTTTPVESAKDPIVKAIEVQEQQVLKILEGLDEMSQKASAQKTGLGNTLNVSA